MSLEGGRGGRGGRGGEVGRGGREGGREGWDDYKKKYVDSNGHIDMIVFLNNKTIDQHITMLLPSNGWLITKGPNSMTEK